MVISCYGKFFLAWFSLFFPVQFKFSLAYILYKLTIILHYRVYFCLYFFLTSTFNSSVLSFFSLSALVFSLSFLFQRFYCFTSAFHSLFFFLFYISLICCSFLFCSIFFSKLFLFFHPNLTASLQGVGKYDIKPIHLLPDYSPLFFPFEEFLRFRSLEISCLRMRVCECVFPAYKTQRYFICSYLLHFYINVSNLHSLHCMHVFFSFFFICWFFFFTYIYTCVIIFLCMWNSKAEFKRFITVGVLRVLIYVLF